jgi:hypothetical protein
MENKFEDLENKIDERFEELENELLDSFRYPFEDLINSPLEELNLLEKISELTNLIGDLTNFCLIALIIMFIILLFKRLTTFINPPLFDKR